MNRESDDIRLIKAWAENVVPEITAIASLDQLSAWIVKNNQKLGQLDYSAPSHWNQIRAMLHAKDGQLRETLRQGVG